MINKEWDIILIGQAVQSETIERYRLRQTPTYTHRLVSMWTGQGYQRRIIYSHDSAVRYDKWKRESNVQHVYKYTESVHSEFNEQNVK